ncbi:MTH938/NDUFAF3 family protein [archaeon]
MFQWTTFGKVKYEDTVFSQDIVISTDGDVYERRAKNPLEITSDELDESIDKKTKILLIGTGHYGVVRLTPDAMAYIKDMKLELVEKETPDAIDYYNERMGAKGRKPKITAIIRVI